MVILGSNSGDKKEEAGLCEEGVPLISRPQQESNPPSQEVRIRISAQEEAEEELSLSFPVPATEKWELEHVVPCINGLQEDTRLNHKAEKSQAARFKIPG